MTVALTTTLALLVAPLGQHGDDLPTPSDLAVLADQVAPSLVVVEYTVRPDKGELPPADWTTRANWLASFGPRTCTVFWIATCLGTWSTPTTSP